MRGKYVPKARSVLPGRDRIQLPIYGAVLAGAVASGGVLVFRTAAARWGIEGLDAARLLGGFFVRESRTAYWLGLAVESFGGVILFPLLYASAVVALTPRRLPGVLLGWLWGALLWTGWATGGMWLLACYHPLVMGGMMQDPGLWMGNLGLAVPLESLIACSLYGILLGLACGRGAT